MRTSTQFGAALLCVALFQFIGLSTAWGNEPRVHEVQIIQSQFDPLVINARPGDIVRWTNQDIVPHTATAEDGSWDSDRIEPGATWQLVITQDFNPNYFCEYHPSMTARFDFD